MLAYSKTFKTMQASGISCVVLFILMFFFLSDDIFSQHIPSKERGDVTKRRKMQMEGNQIRASIFNYGMAGRESGDFPFHVQTPFEWPKNTGKMYLAVMGIVVGAEVKDDNDQIQRIISRCHYLESPQGKPWTFEPIPGYYNESNPEGFASSTDPSTWPNFWPDRMGDNTDPGWPGQWNGYFGKDVFNADQELYFRASDNLYDRYAYYFPDSTDLTRKGLGLILDTRVLTWSQILVQDAMFFLFKIKNDGTKPLDKVGVTILWADFVGGNDGARRNVTEFDILNNIAWSRVNNNRSADFGSDPVGIVGGVFLETPGNPYDRIDNDGDSPEAGKKVTEEMLAGEVSDDGIDNNGNGLIDENMTYVAFGDQVGVTFADGVGQAIDPEWLTTRPRFHRCENNLVTAEMVAAASTDPWKRWPPNPEGDPIQNGQVHLIMLNSSDVGLPWKNGIDLCGHGEEGSPTITQAMIDQASSDAPYYRYRVNDKIILYNVVQSTLGMRYADGIDNNNDGAIDEGIDEGIDVMIDESRDNGIDDDYDWDPLTDDLGVDGISGTGSYGEGNGRPDSGFRFGLPGEPNIDVTDINESDQIGLTGTFYRTSSEWISTYTDNFIWNNFMIPGNFFTGTAEEDDYNLYISSGLFPLQAGQEETISLAVILANGPLPDADGQIRKQALLNKRDYAQETYDNNYQFAKAPAVPKLTAVAGDNKVTLYWDDVAESSFDRYVENIGGNGHNFEGYRIYRSSDPAFEDSKVITNATGSPTYYQPIAQFDLENGIKGYDSVGFEGVHYWLGNDTGLLHSWVDSTVKNGFTYYYAIASYNHGFVQGGIGPAECNFSVSLNLDGTLKKLGTSTNVARVTPEAPAAGYIPPTLGTIDLVQGYTTSKMFYEIVDPLEIKEGHVYYITFEDTIKTGAADTLTTKNFSLYDSTANVLLIDKSTEWGSDVEGALVDGFRLKLLNESRVALDTVNSKWNDSVITRFTFEKYTAPRGTVKGEERPNDYLIIFGEAGFGTSTEFIYQALSGPQIFPSIPVNFKVYNKSTQKFIEFGFLEYDHSGPEPNGWFSAGGTLRDRIVFLEPKGNDTTLGPTWWFYLRSVAGGNYVIPQPGDTATISVFKPFLSADVFRFVAKAGSIDPELAKEQLDRIKVVPNPYIATAQWEMKNPYSSGRGPRSLHFTHLPNKCTIRIFTVNGELVDVIEHDSPFNNGTAYWDMLTRDRLSISYGVYIYHIEAPGIGEKIGKFAVIK
jgi:hypothetical protein